MLRDSWTTVQNRWFVGEDTLGYWESWLLAHVRLFYHILQNTIGHVRLSQGKLQLEGISHHQCRCKPAYWAHPTWHWIFLNEKWVTFTIGKFDEIGAWKCDFFFELLTFCEVKEGLVVFGLIMVRHAKLFYYLNWVVYVISDIYFIEYLNVLYIIPLELF